jgi:lysophospholipase L1-like esterase
MTFTLPNRAWSLAVGGIILVGAGVLWYATRSEPIVNYPSSGTDVIAYGDSLVEGVGSSAGSDFVTLLAAKIGEPIVNLGHSGDTTADGLARIQSLDAYHPKVVVLLLGGNDYLKKVPVAETEKNLGVIIQNIQSRGAIVLLLGVRGGLLNDHFDAMFTRLRDTYHTAFVSDVLSGLLGNNAYMSDEVHPNNAGYALIAARVYPVLRSLLGQ